LFATIGGLGVVVFGVDAHVLLGLALSGLPVFLCFAPSLLVDQGFFLRAFCMTKERALRRPWRDVFA
jgi:hypothetical protein